jgi:hypothetical protein
MASDLMSQSVSTPASYSRSLRFEFQLEDQLAVLTGILVVVLSFTMKIADQCLKQIMTVFFHCTTRSHPITNAT